MQALLHLHQALADPTRWRILMQVAEQLLCVCELEEGLRLPQSTLSGHLTILRKAGLVAVERRGKWAYYRLAEAMRPIFEQQCGQFAEILATEKCFASDRTRIAKRVAMRGTQACRTTARHRPIPPVLAND